MIKMEVKTSTSSKNNNVKKVALSIQEQVKESDQEQVKESIQVQVKESIQEHVKESDQEHVKESDQEQVKDTYNDDDMFYINEYYTYGKIRYFDENDDEI